MKINFTTPKPISQACWSCNLLEQQHRTKRYDQGLMKHGSLSRLIYASVAQCGLFFKPEHKTRDFRYGHLLIYPLDTKHKIHTAAKPLLKPHFKEEIRRTPTKMPAAQKSERRSKGKKPSKSGKPSKVSFGPNKKLKKKKNQTQEELNLKKNPNKKRVSKDVKPTKIAEKPTKNAAPIPLVSPDEHRKFFLDQFEFANDVKLSSLELDSIKDTYFVKLSEGVSQDAGNLGSHVKDVFESNWKEVLCAPQLIEGKIDAGNPAVMVISASAIRSLEMLRGLRILTKECQAVKLFSKHMKVDEQVAMLKKRVNIASGTPNRIKKLAEMEALGLSRLQVIVLDMHTDVKGYSLFSLPQVRDEFWDLYRSYFHERLLQGNLRVCLFGPVSTAAGRTMKKSEDQ